MSTAERAGSGAPGRRSRASGDAPPRQVVYPQDPAAPPAPAEPSSLERTATATESRETTMLRSSVKIGQRQITVRRLDPWTVLKLSVVFYSVLLLLFMLVLTLLWAFLNTIGAVETVIGFANEAQLDVQVNAGQIARAIFLVGLLGVVALSGINVFFCFLYNLVADLTGGMRLTIDDQR